MRNMPPAPGTPRWPHLVLLSTVVTGIHLWLLTGEWPEKSSDAPRPSPVTTAESAGPTSTAMDAHPAGLRPPESVPAVTVSTVRWVLPPLAENPVAAPTIQPTAPPRPARQPGPGPSPKGPREAEPAAAQGSDTPLPPPIAGTADPAEETVSLAQTPPTAERATPSSSAASEAAPAAPPALAHATMPLPPAMAPPSAALAYDVVGNVRGIGYSAQATLDWTLEAGRYDARMAVRLPLMGSRVQTSAGRVGPTGLLPERFADKARSERAAHFDHTEQRIRFSANTPDAELMPGAQDRLSVFLQLAARLNAAPERVQAGQVIELQVAGTTDAEPWRFRVGEEETLNLPAGAQRTRQLVREARQPRDSQVELWLATGLQHLPVRIRIVQHNGDQLDQQLSRLP
jgi:hypothetical protein